MKYDAILQEIGDFGRYQQRVYYVLCLPAAMKAAVIMTSVFILSMPDYKCVTPGRHFGQLPLNQALQNIILETKNTTGVDQFDIDANTDHCYVPNTFDVEFNSSMVTMVRVTALGTHVTSLNASTRTKCDEWSYDTSEVRSTIMTEFDFVCDNSIMRSHTNMGFFAGSLVGGLGVGVLADIIGRKKALQLCIALQLVCGVSMYLVHSQLAVVMLRSLQGVAGEMFALSTCTGMELLGPSRRTFAGMMVEFFWSGGQLLLLLVAWLSREWRLTQLVCGLSAVPLMLAIGFLTPESPRWLLEKGRINEAEQILSRIAQSNNTKMPENAFNDHNTLFREEVSVKTIFANKTLLVRSVVVFFNWFTVNFLYYGLSLNLDNLSGNLYLNFLLGVAVETTGFVICFVFLDKTGRKRLHIGSMLLGSIVCISVIFPVIFGTSEHQWLVTSLCMVGKLCGGICYSVLYIMTVEVFPTAVRNSALGVCMVFENVAGMVAPYVADLGVLTHNHKMKQALPLVVFGSLAAMAALFSLVLPETAGKPLPESVKDAVELSSNKVKEEDSRI